MSAIGPKRTWVVALQISAFDPKRMSAGTSGVLVPVGTMLVLSLEGKNEAT
jgi:hypothetical protein